MPRAVYRRTGTRYLDAWALGIVGNGVVVAGFGVVVVLCFVDLSAGEAALFAACTAAGYVVENLVAGRELRRVGAPVGAWSEGGAAAPAWSAAALLPLALVRRRRLYAIGAVSSVVTSLVLAALL